MKFTATTTTTLEAELKLSRIWRRDHERELSSDDPVLCAVLAREERLSDALQYLRFRAAR